MDLEVVMKKVKFEIEGMKCGGCVEKILNHFKGQQEVEDVMVSLEEGQVVIVGAETLSNMTLKNALNELGFNVLSMKRV